MPKKHKSSGKTGKYTKKQKREQYTEKQWLEWKKKQRAKAKAGRGRGGRRR